MCQSNKTLDPSSPNFAPHLPTAFTARRDGFHSDCFLCVTLYVARSCSRRTCCFAFSEKNRWMDVFNPSFSGPSRLYPQTLKPLHPFRPSSQGGVWENGFSGYLFWVGRKWTAHWAIFPARVVGRQSKFHLVKRRAGVFPPCGMTPPWPLPKGCSDLAFSFLHFRCMFLRSDTNTRQ